MLDRYEVDGQEVSRAEYIRYLFEERDMSRGDIAKELGVPYNVVYSATANMENSHHKRGKRSGGFARKYVQLEDGSEMPRAEYIRKRIQEGATRGEVAKELGISYSAVWAATKGMDVPSVGGKVMITHPETGEQVARVDYIREKWAAGWTRRQIANSIGCDYAVVWAATRNGNGSNNDEVESEDEIYDELE